MSNPVSNKRKGARWEIDLMNYFRENGFDVERLRLSGAEDEGDLVVRDVGALTVIEAKSGAMHPLDFVRQARAEATNYANHRALGVDAVTPLCIVKARGRPAGEGYVLTTVDDYFGIRRAE